MVRNACHKKLKLSTALSQGKLLHDFVHAYAFYQWASNQIKSNLSLYSLYYANACSKFAWGPSPRRCARAIQLLLKKCCSGGKALATLCPL